MPHSVSQATKASSPIVKKTVKGVEVPVCPLETIDYGLILRHDTKEQERLLQACRYPGFFYLSFESKICKEIVRDLKAAYEIEKEYFAEHEDEKKMKDIEIKYDDLANPAIPEPLAESLPLFGRLSESLRSANLNLTVALGDDSGRKRIIESHDPSKPSDTALDLIYAPTKTLAKDAPDNTHTDGGTMTILCSDSWGIKLEDPRTKEWGFVEPKPGTGLCNVADWLDRDSKAGEGAGIDLKGGHANGPSALHSCRHAVSQPSDGFEGRYYVVSYLRPNFQVLHS